MIALLLVFARLFLGLLLREPSVRHRAHVRRRHLRVMIGLAGPTDRLNSRARPSPRAAGV